MYNNGKGGVNITWQDFLNNVKNRVLSEYGHVPNFLMTPATYSEKFVFGNDKEIGDQIDQAGVADDTYVPTHF